MKITALFCCFAVLLAFCGCVGEATQNQSEVGVSDSSTILKETESSTVESALNGSELEDIGDGCFADAGELTYGQQQIILQYMDHYYDSLAALKLCALDKLFDPEAVVQQAGNQAVWEYLIEVRKMQKNDLSLSAYQYDLTCESVEKNGDGVMVRISEHSIQNFTAYPGVNSESFQITHWFILKQQSDETWLIANHLQLDSTYWMIENAYAFWGVEMPSDMSANDAMMESEEEEVQIGTEEDALAFFETRKQELLNTAQLAMAAREQGEIVDVACDEAYDRAAAVSYAMEWVGIRNDEWADYSRNGGNCQNFVSQCLYAGGIPMDTKGMWIWKWYGETPDNTTRKYGRSAQWSGVDFFLDYVQHNNGYGGLSATAGVYYYSGEKGDVLHLGPESDDWRHAVLISEVITNEDGQTVDYLICSNTADLKNFPVSAYPYTSQLLIKIHGWNRT